MRSLVTEYIKNNLSINKVISYSTIQRYNQITWLNLVVTLTFNFLICMVRVAHISKGYVSQHERIQVQSTRVNGNIFQ